MAKLIVNNRYGIAPNDILSNKNITLKAKGLFTYIQSKPDNWEFSIKRMMTQNKDGEKSVRSAIKELEDFGLLKRKPRRKENGDWNGYEYTLYAETASAEKAVTPNAVTPNGYTLSKKEISKKELSKKEINTCENEFSPKIAEIIEKFRKISPALSYGNKTQRNACEEMLKRYGDNALLMADRVIMVQGEPYAPRATTPHAMWMKIGDFAVYFNQEKTNKIVEI